MVEAWLETMTDVADGIACISRAVADDLHMWLEAQRPSRSTQLSLGFFPLGSTLDDTLPTTGMTPDAADALARLEGHAMFLMVGTVEPRKAHAPVLAAFERLWQDGVDAHLVIVGKQGWMMEDLATRLRTHPERGVRLFWFEGASDELLERLYAASTALIAASRGEGFGLPIVEAARHARAC
jgi:glycosyltransferase involved in cell wall biosynthesis